jgi:hypothetical protein
MVPHMPRKKRDADEHSPKKVENNHKEYQAEKLIKIIAELPAKERPHFWELLEEMPGNPLVENFEKLWGAWLQSLGTISKVSAAHRAFLNRMKPTRRKIVRDAEIVELRDSNPKLWSWGRLAKAFEMKRSAVVQAYKRFKETHQNEHHS